jgi:REP element-mobilizing transposase RayT
MPGYDYSTAGWYFVTVCTQDRAAMFGEIMHNEMVPNAAGKMVATTWMEMPQHYPGVVLDAFIVMPDHFHGIMIVGAGPRARPCVHGRDRSPRLDVHGKGHPQGGAPTFSLFDAVQRFKSLTTTRYRYGVIGQKWTPFNGRLWQRNYYEHVIRDDADLYAIRQYIAGNPARWADR